MQLGCMPLFLRSARLPNIMPHLHPMPQGGYDSRRGPPPGMRPMPGGPLPQLHKTQSAYKVRERAGWMAVRGLWNVINSFEVALAPLRAPCLAA